MATAGFTYLTSIFASIIKVVVLVAHRQRLVCYVPILAHRKHVSMAGWIGGMTASRDPSCIFAISKLQPAGSGANSAAE